MVLGFVGIHLLTPEGRLEMTRPAFLGTAFLTTLTALFIPGRAAMVALAAVHQRVNSYNRRQEIKVRLDRTARSLPVAAQTALQEAA